MSFNFQPFHPPTAGTFTSISCLQDLMCAGVTFWVAVTEP